MSKNDKKTAKPQDKKEESKGKSNLEELIF